jgi:hypothetical protein
MLARVVRLAAAGVLLLPSCGPVLRAQEPTADARAVLTRTEYRDELARLRGQIDQLDEGDAAGADRIAAGLPERWRVTTESGVIDARSGWIRDALAAWRRDPRASSRQALADAVLWQEEQAVAAGSRADTAGVRHDLERILSSREFSQVQRPGALAALRQRVLRWLARLVGGALGPSTMTGLTRGLVVLFGVLAAAVLGYSLVRVPRWRERLDHAPLPPPPAPARSWRGVLADARLAADRNDWRESIHLVYWTAIMFLEAEGSWAPDASRTPREYVRLLEPGHQRRAPLETLTGLLEQAWYASASADAGKFRMALSALEQLGCPSR